MTSNYKIINPAPILPPTTSAVRLPNRQIPLGRSAAPTRGMSYPLTRFARGAAAKLVRGDDLLNSRRSLRKSP